MGRGYGRRRKKGIVFLLMLLSIALFSLIMAGTGCFDIKEIVVEGNTFVDRDRIIDISGLNVGTNIFTVRTGELEKDLEAYPYILQAQMERDLPGKVIIHVKERDLAGYIPFMGSYLLLDTEGRVVSATNDMPVKVIPVFEGIVVNDFKVEEVLHIENPEIFDKMVYISDSVVKHLSDYAPIEVNVQDLEDITLDLDNRFLLKIGNLDNLGYKLEYGDTILKDLFNKGISGELDLNNGEKAFFRPW